MAAPKITLYIDVVSPFAYIAFHVLRVGFVGMAGCVGRLLLTAAASELADVCQVQRHLRAHLSWWADEDMRKHGAALYKEYVGLPRRKKKSDLQLTMARQGQMDQR